MLRDKHGDATSLGSHQIRWRIRRQEESERTGIYQQYNIKKGNNLLTHWIKNVFNQLIHSMSDLQVTLK